MLGLSITQQDKQVDAVGVYGQLLGPCWFFSIFCWFC